MQSRCIFLNFKSDFSGLDDDLMDESVFGLVPVREIYARLTGESPSPALPHQMGKGDFFAYIFGDTTLSPSTRWRGREAEGRKGEDSGAGP